MTGNLVITIGRECGGIADTGGEEERTVRGNF